MKNVVLFKRKKMERNKCHKDRKKSQNVKKREERKREAVEIGRKEQLRLLTFHQKIKLVNEAPNRQLKTRKLAAQRTIMGGRGDKMEIIDPG